MGTLSPTISDWLPAGFAKLRVFEAQAAVVDGVAYDEQNAVDGEGLFEEVVGAEFGCLDGGFDGAVAGDHDDDGAIGGGDALDAAEGFEAVDSGQPDIEQNHFVDGGGERVETLLSGLGGVGEEAFVGAGRR